MNGGAGFVGQLKVRTAPSIEGTYSGMYPLCPPVRRGIAALPLGRVVLTVNLVDPSLKPLTGPVQLDAQVKPVPILADFGL